MTLSFLGVIGLVMLFLAEADRDLLAIVTGVAVTALVLSGLVIRNRRGTQVTSARPAHAARVEVGTAADG